MYGIKPKPDLLEHTFLLVYMTCTRTCSCRTLLGLQQHLPYRPSLSTSGQQMLTQVLEFALFDDWTSLICEPCAYWTMLHDLHILDTGVSAGNTLSIQFQSCFEP